LQARRDDQRVNERSFNGEFTFVDLAVEGTFIDALVVSPRLKTISVETIDQGIAVADDATGTGYLLFSAEDLFTRLPSPGPRSGSDRQMIAVRYADGHWQYNSNDMWVNFVPSDSDRLIARLDFDSDRVEPLQNAVGSVHGIDQGYFGGDLEFTANRWNGRPNAGEFSVEGTYFNVESDSPLASAVAEGSADTNSDGLLTVSDALRVINHLGAATLPEFQIDTPLDVNKDGFVSPRDALNVINLLASQTDGDDTAEAEGWSAVDPVSGFGLMPKAVDLLFQDEEDDDEIGLSTKM
ncbi:MAG: dockerin type I domain-containing protein, partial [Planctomycetota bacterium]